MGRGSAGSEPGSKGGKKCMGGRRMGGRQENGREAGFSRWQEPGEIVKMFATLCNIFQ